MTSLHSHLFLAQADLPNIEWSNSVRWAWERDRWLW